MYFFSKSPANKVANYSLTKNSMYVKTLATQELILTWHSSILRVKSGSFSVLSSLLANTKFSQVNYDGSLPFFWKYNDFTIGAHHSKVLAYPGAHSLYSMFKASAETFYSPPAYWKTHSAGSRTLKVYLKRSKLWKTCRNGKAK